MKEEKLEWRSAIKKYESPRISRSLWQAVNTLIPFLGLWYLAYLSLHISYVLTLLISLLASGMLVRIFIVFHDCCHQSFFKNRLANDILGNIGGIITLFPFRKWANEHNIHHATCSNLDKRGVGDLWTMTAQEYQEAAKIRRLLYRLYRNPLVMFGLGPIGVFLLQNRFNRKEAKLKERINTYFINIMCVAWVLTITHYIGWEAFLLVQVPIFLVSGAAGIWLFFIQHTFKDAYYERQENWSFVEAAIKGSSYYQLPKVIQWITGNIGFHHIHHLSSRIPNYFLELVHKQNPVFQQTETITFRKSLRSLKMDLWDENLKRFISFKELKGVSDGI